MVRRANPGEKRGIYFWIAGYSGGGERKIRGEKKGEFGEILEEQAGYSETRKKNRGEKKTLERKPGGDFLVSGEDTEERERSPEVVSRRE